MFLVYLMISLCVLLMASVIERRSLRVHPIAPWFLLCLSAGFLFAAWSSLVLK